MTHFSKLATDRAHDAGFVAVLDEIRARRDEFARLRHIPQDMVAKLQGIGVYRAFVPGRFGGDDLSPADFCRLIEDISAADASTGWVASFGVSATYLAALPPATYGAIYGADPDTVFAGAMFPPQPAAVVAGGYAVKGQWPWASGVMGASLVGAGIRVEGDDTPLPRIAVMARDRVEVVDTWNTIGLSATGSHDIRADDVVVSPDWTFVRGGGPTMDDQIFRYPAMCLAAQVLAVVALGTAREALDQLAASAGRQSVTGAPKPGARPYVQAEYAKARAILLGAKSAFYTTIEEAWDELGRSGSVSPDTRLQLRLVATKAAHDGAEAARRAFLLGGSTAIETGHPLGRCMIDAAAVAQHAFMAEGTWTAAGATVFDEPTMPGYP